MVELTFLQDAQFSWKGTILQTPETCLHLYQVFFSYDNFIYNRISRFDLTLRKNQFEGKNAKFTFHAFQLKPLVMHTQIATYNASVNKN